MNVAEKELLQKLYDTFEKWNTDLKDARDDYKTSASILDKARESFEKNKSSFWSRFIPYIPLVIVGGFILYSFYLINFATCGTWSLVIDKFSFTKPCPMP